MAVGAFLVGVVTEHARELTQNALLCGAFKISLSDVTRFTLLRQRAGTLQTRSVAFQAVLAGVVTESACLAKNALCRAWFVVGIPQQTPFAVGDVGAVAVRARKDARLTGRGRVVSVLACRAVVAHHIVPRHVARLWTGKAYLQVRVEVVQLDVTAQTVVL